MTAAQAPDGNAQVRRAAEIPWRGRAPIVEVQPKTRPTIAPDIVVKFVMLTALEWIVCRRFRERPVHVPSARDQVRTVFVHQSRGRGRVDDEFDGIKKEVARRGRHAPCQFDVQFRNGRQIQRSVAFQRPNRHFHQRINRASGENIDGISGRAVLALELQLSLVARRHAPHRNLDVGEIAEIGRPGRQIEPNICRRANAGVRKLEMLRTLKRIIRRYFSQRTICGRVRGEKVGSVFVNFERLAVGKNSKKQGNERTEDGADFHKSQFLGGNRLKKIATNFTKQRPILRKLWWFIFEQKLDGF